MGEQMKAGDVVYGSLGRFGAIDVRRGTVTKVTPKGQIVADFNERYAGNNASKFRRFNKRGVEMTGELYYAAALISEEEYRRLLPHSELRKALKQASLAARGATFSKADDITALIVKLQAIAHRLTNGGDHG
jgi:hypothetical protein